MTGIIALLSVALLFSQAIPALAEGWLYTDSTAPSGIEIQTKNSSKVGKAICNNVLNLVEWGDCSFDAAMKNGQINQVHHHDTNVMGWIFFKKVTTYVYGD